MSKRSLRVRGFGLTVELPDRSAGEQVVDGGGGLVVKAPPPIDVAKREQERAFVESFAEDPEREWGALVDDHDEVSAHTWYHTIELPDGTATPGMYDHRPLLPHYGLPEDLSGLRALDIGSADGFWAFELEKRGAEVTSLDITMFAETDFPRALRRTYLDRPLPLPFRRGMEIAHRRLGSTVKLVNLPVYDLDPDVHGTFDFVHAGDILLHLRDPALALQRIRDVTRGRCLFADSYDPALDELGAGAGLTRFLGGWSDATWWSPALSTLAQMVADAGFDDVEVVTTYKLPPRGAEDGPWRAVIRGRA
jgi:tRNA (mo5U34)-methyltransferase